MDDPWAFLKYLANPAKGLSWVAPCYLHRQQDPRIPHRSRSVAQMSRLGAYWLSHIRQSERDGTVPLHDCNWTLPTKGGRDNPFHRVWPFLFRQPGGNWRIDSRTPACLLQDPLHDPIVVLHRGPILSVFLL